MIKSIKIRLIPTKEQEELMFKSTGIARFTYNWGLAKWNELHNNGDKPSKVNIRTEFNNTVKKQEEFKWLNEVSAQVTAYAFEDLNDAFQNFFNGTSDRPKFKSKRKSKKVFLLDMTLLNFIMGRSI